MRNIQPDRCYRLRYPDGSTVDFRTQNTLPVAFHLIRVKLRTKRIVNIVELLMKPWDEFHEIDCTGELEGADVAF
ncbi:MAG: hypothetical protein Q8916_00800 [Bacteroidota bacterium]|nr:hypothetical protein [Bacteroidota bacterium]MDP4228924.1 hypothetical protein [Bacteroidota bacterium]MDP4236402.1 hypothetical protein [Bacteroidota bacterium]